MAHQNFRLNVKKPSRKTYTKKTKKVWTAMVLLVCYNTQTTRRFILFYEYTVDFYGKFEQEYRVSSLQAKAARDIMQCRTSVLGGHIYECEECRHWMILYNSCRNWHCGLCQTLPRAVWVDERTEDILDAPYFHLIFTIPKGLHRMVYQNQKQLYSLLLLEEVLF